MPFHPLAHICQWKYWEQLFLFIWRWPLLLFADFLDLHFVFGVLNIVVWPPLCWKRGLWESWLSLFCSIKGGIRFHCLTRHFLISLAWLSMMLSLEGTVPRTLGKDIHLAYYLSPINERVFIPSEVKNTDSRNTPNSLFWVYINISCISDICLLKLKALFPFWGYLISFYFFFKLFSRKEVTLHTK